MRRYKRKPPMSSINVVPYIDVMLVLLIIFMVTAPLLQQGVEIDLPTADANPIDDSSTDTLVVSVDAEGNYYLDVGDGADQPKAGEEIKTYVAAVLRHKPETKVMLRGDKSVDYGKVMGAMVLLQHAGVPSVGFLTDPPEQQN